MPGKLVDYISEICETIGPRIAGSPEEAETAEYLKKKLRPMSNSVTLEEFKCRPGVLQGLIVFEIVSILLAFILYFILPVLTILIIVVSILILFLTRMRGKEIIDVLFRSATSENVIAKIKPKEKAKRKVIFSGHHDSAFYMPLFAKQKKRLHILQNIPVYSAIIFAIIAVAKSVWIYIDLSTGINSLKMSLGFFTFTELIRFNLLIDIPAVIVGLVSVLSGFYFAFNMVTKTKVMGANDNLSAVGVLLGIAEKVSNNPPKSTEVWIVSFGTEEPATLGSKVFAEKHGKELENAYVINMETVGQGKFGVVTKEISVAGNLSKELADLVVRAGKKCKVPVKPIELKYGNTDATPIARKGYKSVTVMGMDENELFTLWHIPEDIPKNISEKNLQNALKLCLQILEDIDSIS
ncbi:MAG: M28 family metallopeptidase [Candidatus Jordarchaeum sp.]|uniref:M28 family metallopeptidase n=1 Tax=Candidatus Jordarchaeum sp. TaxID=2823881 RepID=UPI00404B9FBA